MSRKKGHARKRRKHAKRRDRAVLLTAVADALNACEQAGMSVRVLPGPVVWTTAGAVLPPVKAGDQWLARPFRARRPMPVEDVGSGKR